MNFLTLELESYKLYEIILCQVGKYCSCGCFCCLCACVCGCPYIHDIQPDAIFIDYSDFVTNLQKCSF